ncbi:MAG: DUF5615 family PIN-like protein [Bacteroidota bacterium]|nr:DUF5615 family PIN-like protein [Bacteroidota bacterium]
MKILIDENIDVRFKILFNKSAHEVYTVRDLGWNGIKNGVLLQLLKENNFDCWIVVDKNIRHQQNIAKLSCQVIVLDVYKNTLEHITKLFPAVLGALENISTNNLIIIPEV